MKARIDEFSALAGHELIHAGMTSRDLTENVEQLQVRSALGRSCASRMVAALARLARLAAEHATLVMAGRSHNVPAQAITVGKRFANAGEELLVALGRVDDLVARYPLRGIKGPVGTQQDMVDLLGSAEAALAVEQAVAADLGFDAVLGSVGQVYPRSLDLDVVSALVQAASAPANLATTLRLMAGQELVTEGFQAGQVGLVGHAAQDERPVLRADLRPRPRAGRPPRDGHRARRRPVERGRRELLGRAPGRAARRFFAADGLYETLLTVLDELGVFPAVIDRELRRYLPFLATTKVLMAAVRAGVGREVAHEVIKEHAVAVALAMREKGIDAQRPARAAGRRRAPRARRGDACGRSCPNPIEFVGAGAGPGRGVRRAGRGAGGGRSRRGGLRPGRDPVSNEQMTDELPHVYSGKVRDIYDAGDGRWLMVTSDRISAFDVVMDEPVPDKGRVLTAMSAFWFDAPRRRVTGNHLVSTDLADCPPEAAASGPEWAGRVMLCRRAEMVPVECIVRGYLTGSAWKEYRAEGTMHGVPLPSGMRESDRLPEPVFTPSTKAEVGDHDENISFERAVDLVGKEMAEALRDVSLHCYQRGADGRPSGASSSPTPSSSSG